MKKAKDLLYAIPTLFAIAFIVLLVIGIIKDNEALGGLALICGFMFIASGTIIANTID